MTLSGKIQIPASLCMKCRGGKLLCGLSYCPISVKLMAKKIMESHKPGRTLEGSSPPSVFVGRYGYPKINIYPSSPPFHGDTSRLEKTSEWLSMGMEEFLSMRLSLLRGSTPVEVTQAADPGRLFQEIQLMAISGKPVEVDMELEKPIGGQDVILDEHASPMGPSSPLKRISIDYGAPDHHIEKAYSDTDLKAADAMKYLYSSGIQVDRISSIISIGALGEKKRRRAVPTRWAITASDKSISDSLVKEIRDYQQISSFEVYVRPTYGNLFMGILTPSNWIYEWGESWFPGSTWNQWGDHAEIELDYEGYNFRKDYPDIGGCYYSTRLAVAEKFKSMRRRGGAITWREIYPGFNLPVGVWHVRENMRALFSSEPMRFGTLQECVRYLSDFTQVPVENWVRKSYVYPTLTTNNLDRFLEMKS